MIRSLRDEAFLLLEGHGAILETARDVGRIMSDAGIDGAIIGGVAVVLHGYVRTTVDVDVFVNGPLKPLSEALQENGFRFFSSRREFRRSAVPVHLVTKDQTRMTPSAKERIEDVEVVSLPDLITMKLASGLREPLRAIDLADVIGLIRARRLTADFAARLSKEVRPEFRKLARAVVRQRR